MKLLLLVALVGFAASASVGRRGIVRNGVEYLPIEDLLRQFPEEYPLFQETDEPQPEREGRITNGELASGPIPYQVALFLNTAQGSFFCGGIIIGPNTILTAAHCVPNLRSVEILAGATNIRRTEPSQQSIEVDASNVRAHESYNAQRLENDVALINIPGNGLALNNNVGVAKLPTRALGQEDLTGQNARTSGWGRPSDSTSSISDDLREVVTKVLTNQQCAQTFGNIITPKQICLDGAGGKSACNGDSGGPTVLADRENTLVGVVSFGSSAGCSRGYPHAYSRVTEFIEWIEQYSPVRFG